MVKFPYVLLITTLNLVHFLLLAYFFRDGRSLMVVSSCFHAHVRKPKNRHQS